jgi:hypothetical protein
MDRSMLYNSYSKCRVVLGIALKRSERENLSRQEERQVIDWGLLHNRVFWIAVLLI